MRRATWMTAVVAALALMAPAYVLTTAPAHAVPVAACGTWGCGSTTGTSDGDSDSQSSSGTQYAPVSPPPTLNRPAMTCSVYANGTGVGSFCVRVGLFKNVTLRERFSGQKLQRCRYDELPPALAGQFNARPEDGRYMLMSCINGIDWDTFEGGPKRSLSISVVFVENGTDTSDVNNPVSNFLWDKVQESGQMPVPFLKAQPNLTPVVGVPTFFTFRWLDPTTQEVVRQGPYRDRLDGGPFIEVDNSRTGVLIRAQATKITVNPNQRGIAPVTCRPGTPYTVGAPAGQQPAGACQITFPRSSASSREFATKPIPAGVNDAFNADVTVHWKVEYGGGPDDLQAFDTEFVMRLQQVIPVQEVQAPNQPPTVIY